MLFLYVLHVKGRTVVVLYSISGAESPIQDGMSLEFWVFDSKFQEYVVENELYRKYCYFLNFFVRKEVHKVNK